MSRTIINSYTCDRCKTRLECRTDSDMRAYYEWGRIMVQQSNGPISIGQGPSTSLAPLDICPTCVAAIGKWWNARPSKGERAIDVFARDIGE